MNAESMVTVIVALTGLAISWGVWTSVSVFKHAQEIALLKQEVKILSEVKHVLIDIRYMMRHGKPAPNLDA